MLKRLSTVGTGVRCTTTTKCRDQRQSNDCNAYDRASVGAATVPAADISPRILGCVMCATRGETIPVIVTRTVGDVNPSAKNNVHISLHNAYSSLTITVVPYKLCVEL